MANIIVGDIEYKNINNIIFDLGGVIIDIDFQITIKAFKKLGIEHFDQLYTQFKQSPIFDNLDKGRIFSADFRNGICELAHVKISDVDFDNAWNGMLLELPSKRIVLLNKLKSRFSTFLLSNTNEIHLEHFFERMKQEHRLNDFDVLFHKAYYSCRIDMRKPDAEIYYKVLIDNNLKPEETLFIDDLEHNIEAAKKLGIQTYLKDRNLELTDLFKKFD